MEETETAPQHSILELIACCISEVIKALILGV